MYLWGTLILIVLILLYFYIQNNILSITKYTPLISTLHPELKGKKIVFISDTHFRARNSHIFIDRLLIEIEKLDPDLILFGGDIVHKVTGEAVFEETKDFFMQLGKIAPTYVIFGNHDYATKRVNKISGVLKNAGVTLLDNESVWISFEEKEAGFWLMGLNEYTSTIQNMKDPLAKIKLPKYTENDSKILLAHYPHYFEKYLVNKEKRPDLVLAGHAHGGQVILPIIGGLFSPGEGRNPYYDYGLFASKDYPSSRLILTRGLGNSSFPQRINNRPEIVLIEFK